MSFPVLDKSLVEFTVKNVLVIGIAIRLFLAWFLPYLLDNGTWIPGVAYTDVDYYVFTDAANLVSDGRSPFERHTYRYTPFLALVLSWVNSIFGSNGGRYLFCLADSACGWLICQIRQGQRRTQEPLNSKEQEIWLQFQDALWWMYNPFAVNICTRGSAESFAVLLPVLLTVVTTTTTENKKNDTQRVRALAAGVLHGVSVHSKLYPIIYSLSYMACFGSLSDKRQQNGRQQDRPKRQREKTAVMFVQELLWTWFRRLTTPLPLLFFGSFLTTFTFLTWLAVALYGQKSLDEGILYHLSRIDHRHNYSMFWYFIYLIRGSKSSSAVLLSWLGRLLLMPQAILLVYSSLGIGPFDLSFCLFVQTYLFVTFNKVITAQYFTWYLCLLPLCSQSLSVEKRVQRAACWLILSVVCWLGCAYCLEMQGMAVHRLVYMASVGFFVTNVNMLSAILQSYQTKSQQASIQQQEEQQKKND